MKALTPLTLATALLFAPACDDEDAAPPDGSAMAGDAGAPTDGGGSTADVAAGDTAPTTGDGGATGDAFTSSSGAWVVFDVPDAGPLAMGIMGSAEAFALDGGKTKVVLTVSGLMPNTEYGAHVHKLACADMMAGGHYQNMPPTPDAAATDPMFGNATNEIWLDFKTDLGGKAIKETTVDFRVRTGEAKAIVVHKMTTGPGGLAGPKLACLNIAF